MKILIVIIVALAAFIGLKILQLLIKRLAKRYVSWKKWSNIMPLAGLIVWLIILFWALNFLFQDKSYYNVIIISIIVVLSLTIGWFFLKDIISGIVFRIQNDYSYGEFVQFGEITGRLNEMQLTHISLHTMDGKSIKIPYSRLSNEIISLKLETKSYEQNKFTIKINKKYQKKEIEDFIIAALNKSHWRLGYTLPQVKFLNEDQNYYLFEIQVQVRNQKHLDYIKNTLTKRFTSM
jgi:hypothetical protein